LLNFSVSEILVGTETNSGLGVRINLLVLVEVEVEVEARVDPVLEVVFNVDRDLGVNFARFGFEILKEVGIGRICMLTSCGNETPTIFTNFGTVMGAEL